jgi:hypothetical protein
MLATGRLPWSFALAAGLVLAACSAGAAGSPPAATSTPAPPTATATPAAPIVIEDAGVETDLAAGTYASRLFRPVLTMQLGTGWYRKDPNTDRQLRLRYVPGDAGDMTILGGIDYLQCGTDAVIEHPNAQAIVDALAAATTLKVERLDPVSIGALSGSAVRLAGGGEAVPQDPLADWVKYGCVLTQGAEPFPAEAGWTPLLRDAATQLILVDVGDTTVVVRARPTNDADAIYKAVLEVVGTMSLG